MRTAFSLATLALLLAPNACFAEDVIYPVTPEEAENLGIEVRVTAAGPDAVNMEMEFGLENEFKEFSRVDLRIGEQSDRMVVAPLREDRSEEGHVTVSLTAARSELENLSVWIMVPGGLGGVAYDMQLDDFVE